jgi:hypothetical protein
MCQNEVNWGQLPSPEILQCKPLQVEGCEWYERDGHNAGYALVVGLS